MLSRHSLLLPALLAGLTLTAALPAQAQSDMRGLADRLDQVERSLSQVQGQVYRNGGGNGSVVITSPAAGGGDGYSRLEDRINQLEQQLRDVTNDVEKANHNSAVLGQRLDRLQGDYDLRLKDLEARLVGGTGAAMAQSGQPGVVGQPGQPGAIPPAVPPANAAPNRTGTNGPQGYLIPNEQRAATAQPVPLQPSVAPAQPAAPTQPRSAQEQFDQAFNQLRANDYENAARGMQAVVDRFPNDPLVANALFWLGRISSSQGQHEAAARSYYDSYKRFPKSAKAGESLLNVGLAMSSLGKKKEACVAIARFQTEFPDALDSFKRQAAAEKQKLACP